MSFFRTILLYTTAFFATVFLGGAVLIAGLFGVEDKPNSIYDKVPRWWSIAALWAVGVKVRVHGMEHVNVGEPQLCGSNHVSWFDVHSTAQALPV